MIGDSIYDLRTYLRGHEVLFCYSGAVNEKVLTGIGDALKRKMSMDGADTRSARGVFSVFVEQMQNIIRYSEEAEPEQDGLSGELRHGVLVVGRRDDAYFVVCGNMIRSSEVQRLNTALSEIQGMTRDEIKKRFKAVLRGAVPKGSKGAGVGFMDIALRATRPIDFRFQDIDEDMAFFTLEAVI
ncbi:SiaB family protein kinase [Magnetospira sp. QH-2]|uniref:SiaB family protein kinase n=1 Tax=Magnetospira sp. (strain QH-2) TaxID=1288970 RepID=UPI0003E81921|nr:SiaB family protein kinase [Magnetospira sp. QH-2]CCQ74693.1 conserved protein of unknown function [Magnetospira sp. QH-2]